MYIISSFTSKLRLSIRCSREIRAFTTTRTLFSAFKIMAPLRMPYQCMEKCGSMLVAARGSSIDLFDLQDGSLVSTWNCPAVQTPQKEKTVVEEATPKLIPQKSESSSVDITLDTASPPAKRRKLSISKENDLKENDVKENSKPDSKDEVPAELEVVPKKDSKQAKKKQNNRSVAISTGLETPAVIVLAVTKDGSHVVAVTGEDKSIRVFEHSTENGVRLLKQLSQRAMPKRPCALTITPDDSTIISADKFGDVYSLPLLYIEKALTPTASTATPEPATKFIPAANELTIHSQRNRKALENQRRQTPKTPQNTEPTFEHTLLLGHVSMLTDITLVTLNKKSYIITADRDEHIRVSRAIPQAHIIEGFCLGHTEFVSRICVPETRPEVLISGGGDEELFVWRWEGGELVGKTNLSSHVLGVRKELDQGKEVERSTEGVKLAVSGIYHVKSELSMTTVLPDIIIVTCEGLPTLFTFILTHTNSLLHLETFTLPGNALAVLTNVQSPNSGKPHILVSIDTIHRPGSTTELKDSTVATTNPLLSFDFSDDGKLLQADDLVKHMAVVNEADGVESVVGQLKNLLYNLENLRKRDADGFEE